MDQENGGPSGCLQYFTAPEAIVSSFNYPVGAAANCALCFSPDVRAAAIDQSFGLSVTAIADNGAVDAACVTDYLVIPGAMVSAVLMPPMAQNMAIANPKAML